MATDHVLTEASAIICGHSPPIPPPPVPPPPPSSGTVKITPPSTLLTVAGKGVLVLTAPTAPVQNCPIPATPSSKPCTTVSGIAGTAQHLEVGGAPVLLATAFTGTPDGGPPVPPAVKPSASAGQTLLRAE
jgi:hypothetical protein